MPPPKRASRATLPPTGASGPGTTDFLRSARFSDDSPHLPTATSISVPFATRIRVSWVCAEADVLLSGCHLVRLLLARTGNDDTGLIFEFLVPRKVAALARECAVPVLVDYGDGLALGANLGLLDHCGLVRDAAAAARVFKLFAFFHGLRRDDRGLDPVARTGRASEHIGGLHFAEIGDLDARSLRGWLRLRWGCGVCDFVLRSQHRGSRLRSRRLPSSRRT